MPRAKRGGVSDSDFLGWSDAHPKTTDAQRVAAAIACYGRKHGSQPTLVIVNAAQVPEQMPMEAAGIEVRGETWASMNNVYVTREVNAA